MTQETETHREGETGRDREREGERVKECMCVILKTGMSEWIPSACDYEPLHKIYPLFAVHACASSIRLWGMDAV